MNPPSIPRIGFILVALATSFDVAPSFAQPANKVVPFLTTRATKADYDTRVRTVALRPNAEFTYFVHLQNNDSQNLDTLIVQLTSDAEGKKILAQESIAEIKPGEIVGVPMSAVAAKVPAVVPPPMPRGTELNDRLYLWVIDAKLTPAQIKMGNDPYLYRPDIGIDIRLKRPNEYLSFASQYSDDTLQIILGDFDPPLNRDPVEVLETGPAKVTMELFNAPLGDEPIDSVMTPALRQKATLQTFVRDGATDTRLIVKNLAASNRQLFVALTVDGYSGAFVYKTDLGGTSPLPSTESFLRVAAPRYAIPGKPLNAELQVFADIAVGTPVLEFQRAEFGDPEIVTSGRTTPRDQRTANEISETGGLTFIQSTQNWTIPIDSTGVYGRRSLRFRLADTETTAAIRPGVTPLILDDTPPMVQSLKVILPLETLYGKDSYFVSSLKPADANARAIGSATVVAGKTAKLSLNLKR